MIEKIEISQESPQVSKDSFPSCEQCAWKHEKLAGTSPCEYCIRNPEIVSKRWNGPKELIIQKVQIIVPRDMYVSEEMLEFFKIIISAYSKENALLQAMLEANKRRSPSIYEPMWQYPQWRVTTGDNKNYQTMWLSYAAKMKKKDMLIQK